MAPFLGLGARQTCSFVCLPHSVGISVFVLFCFVFCFFSIPSPYSNKKFLFLFPCRETIPGDMVEAKISSLPSHHQVWPNVTQVSQSEYPVLLGTEII